MAISWKLKTYLSQNHSIYKATELQKKIIKNAGVIISIQNICNLMNSKPKTIRLETMEIICTALNCKLSDFCSITPSKKKVTTLIKLSFKNTPNTKRGISSFPDPTDYQ